MKESPELGSRAVLDGGAPVGWVDVVNSACESQFDRLGTVQGLVSGRPKRKGCDDAGSEGSLLRRVCGVVDCSIVEEQ